MGWPVLLEALPREAIGLFGASLYVTNYLMLTFRLTSSERVRYFAVNLAAGSCLLVGLTAQFNLAAALLQSFFIVCSLLAIVLRLLRRRRPRDGARTATPSFRAGLRS